MKNMADPHETFSVRAEVDSLHALEARLIEEHPDWTPDQIKFERRSIYRNEMFPSQRDSYLAEKDKVEDMHFDAAQWQVQDGELVNRGYSFQSMIDHASSEQEKASLIAWKQTALSVESGGRIVSLDYHVQSDGEFKIRYGDVWIKEGNTIKQERRLDLSKGNDMDLFTGLQLIQELSKEEGKKIVYDEKNNVGLLIINPGAEDSDSLKQKLQSSARIFSSANSAVNRIVSEVQQTAVQVVDGVAHEIHVTAVAIAEFMERQRRKNEENEPFLHLEFSSSETLKEIFINPEKAEALKVLSTEPEEVGVWNLTDEEAVAIWIATAEDELQITPEQAHEMVAVIEQTWEAMGDAATLIEFAVDPDTEGVAIPAALFALDILANPELMLIENSEEIAGRVQQENAIGQAIGLPLTDEVEPIGVELKNTIFAFLTSEEPSASSTMGLDTHESIHVTQQAEQLLRAEGVDVEALGNIKDIITTINEVPVEQAVAVIEHEEEIVIIHMVEAQEVLEELLQNYESTTVGEAEQGVETHVEQFSTLVLLWLLLKLDSYRQSLAALKDVVLGKKESQSVLDALKEEISATLIPKEPTRFILLGIIWHLNQIREQGFASHSHYVPPPIVQKKKKNIQTYSLPAQGIIFAVAS